MDELFGDIYGYDSDDRRYILIIYDIVNNSRRLKLSKYLLGYGNRVQKSSFEAIISKKKLQELLSGLPKYVDKSEDSIRVYEISGKEKVSSFGIEIDYSVDDIIVL